MTLERADAGADLAANATNKAAHAAYSHGAQSTPVSAFACGGRWDSLIQLLLMVFGTRSGLGDDLRPPPTRAECPP